MKVFYVFLFIFTTCASLLGETGDSRTRSSHYFTAFGLQGQRIFGSQDLRTGNGFSYGYGRPEPKFRWGQIPAQLVYEGYLDHTESRGAQGRPPNRTYALGGLAYSRWRWPLDKMGNGVYADIGWGFQLADHPTLDLDSQFNSTPFLTFGGTFKYGEREFMVGLRYLHISNANLKGRNRGENELLLSVGFRY